MKIIQISDSMKKSVQSFIELNESVRKASFYSSGFSQTFSILFPEKAKKIKKEKQILEKIKSLKNILHESHFNCFGCELEISYCEGRRCREQLENIFDVQKKERSEMIRETFGSKFNNLSITIKNKLRNDN